MVRVLSEEPDPWEREPELPKRTVHLTELSEDARLMRKGEGPIRDYWEGVSSVLCYCSGFVVVFFFAIYLAFCTLCLVSVWCLPLDFADWKE
mmetsp:Transcript_41974/g.164483  ORF Transcript_41974/g.164483 Transcript_41974/m.164483 type:complete len:92 (-) Transcript_41974:1224-1499(-)